MAHLERKNLLLLSLPSLIFIFAFLIRFVFLLEIMDHPLFIPILTGLDPALYHNTAYQILEGNFKQVYQGTLLYPMILAGIYSISNANVLIAKIIQIILGSLSCVLIFFITKKIFNKKSAIIASIIGISYPVAIIHEAILIYTSYVIFLNLCGILILLSKRLSVIKTFISGLLIGLSFLLSPQNIFFIIGIFIWILIYHRMNFKLISGILIGLILIVMPFLLRNYIVGRYVSPTTPYAGIGFYIGNNSNAEGIFKPIPGIRYSIKGQTEDFRLIAEANCGTKLSASQVSLYWIRKGIEFIKNNPFKYLRLELKKLLLFLNAEEHPDLIQNVDYFKSYSNLIKFLSIISFGIIGPLGLMGIMVGVGQNRGAKLLFIYILSYLIMLLIFYVTSRYRLPAVYGFFPFAGYYINLILTIIKKKKFKPIFYNMIGLILFGLATNINIPVVKSKTLSHYNQGVIYIAKGKLNKALNEYRVALQENPHDVNAHFGIGEVYFKQEKFKMAVLKFKQCIKLRPTFLDAYYNLGLSLFKMNKPKQAAKYLNILLDFNFEDAEAHFLLAKVYLRMGKCKQAMNEFSTAIYFDPSLKGFVKKEIESTDLGKCSDFLHRF